MTKYKLICVAALFLFGVAGCSRSTTRLRPTLTPTAVVAPSPTALAMIPATGEQSSVPPPTRSPTPWVAEPAVPSTTPLPTAAQVLPRAAPAATPIPPAPSCGRPARWVPYTVRAGDTLYSLAMTTGTTVGRIQQANCLQGTIILIGQTLYLPTLPALPVATATPTGEQAKLPPPPPTPEKLPAPGPGEPRLDIDPFSGPAGTVHTIQITGFGSGETIAVELVFVPTQETILTVPAVASADGAATVLITSQPGYLVGPYVVQATGDAGSYADGSLVIDEPAPTQVPTAAPTPIDFTPTPTASVPGPTWTPGPPPEATPTLPLPTQTWTPAPEPTPATPQWTPTSTPTPEPTTPAPPATPTATPPPPADTPLPTPEPTTTTPPLPTATPLPPTPVPTSTPEG